MKKSRKQQQQQQQLQPVDLFIQDLVRHKSAMMIQDYNSSGDSDGSTVSTQRKVTAKAQHPLRAFRSCTPPDETTTNCSSRLVVVSDNARVFAKARPKHISSSISPPTAADRKKLTASNRWGADCISTLSLDEPPRSSSTIVTGSNNRSSPMMLRPTIRRRMSDSCLTMPIRSWKEPQQASDQPPVLRPRSPRSASKAMGQEQQQQLLPMSFNCNLDTEDSSIGTCRKILEAATNVTHSKQRKPSRRDSMELTASAIAAAQKRSKSRPNKSWSIETVDNTVCASPSRKQQQQQHPPMTMSSGSNHGSSSKFSRIIGKSFKTQEGSGGKTNSRRKMRRRLSATYDLKDAREAGIRSNSSKLQVLQKALGDLAPNKKRSKDKTALNSARCTSRW